MEQHQATRRTAIRVTFMVAMGVATQNAFAIPIVFGDELAFRTAALAQDVSLVSETLEPAPDGEIVAPAIVFDDLSITGVGGLVRHVSVASTSSSIFTAGTGWASFTTPTVLEIAFASPVNAFAIDLYDALERPNAIFSVSSPDAGFDVIVATTGSEALPGSSFLFFGLLSDTAFTQIRLYETSPVAGDVIFFDRIQRGAAGVTTVPEPPTILLLAFGVLAALRFRARDVLRVPGIVRAHS